eukprot:gene2179-3202_t
MQRGSAAGHSGAGDGAAAAGGAPATATSRARGGRPGRGGADPAALAAADAVCVVLRRLHGDGCNYNNEWVREAVRACAWAAAKAAACECEGGDEAPTKEGKKKRTRRSGKASRERRAQRRAAARTATPAAASADAAPAPADGAAAMADADLYPEPRDDWGLPNDRAQLCKCTQKELEDGLEIMWMETCTTGNTAPFLRDSDVAAVICELNQPRRLPRSRRFEELEQACVRVVSQLSETP